MVMKVLLVLGYCRIGRKCFLLIFERKNCCLLGLLEEFYTFLGVYFLTQISCRIYSLMLISTYLQFKGSNKIENFVQNSPKSSKSFA